MNDNELGLAALSISGLQALAGQLDELRQSDSPGVARWASAWWWKVAAELGSRDAGDGDLDGLTDAELDSLGKHLRVHAQPDEAGGGLRHAATAMAEQSLDRAYAKGRVDAEFATIAAEENRRRRESQPTGGPMGDTTGIAGWKEATTGQAPPDDEGDG